VHYCLHNIERSFSHIMTNFPLRPAAWLMRMIVFPIGRHFHEPTDRLGHEIANLLLQPSAARDRLTRGVFISDDPNDAMGRIEIALPKVIAAEPVERKLRNAQKRGDIDGATPEALVEAGLAAQLINKEEAALVAEATKARLNAISVDDFASL